MRADKQTLLFVWNAYACRLPVVPASQYFFRTGTKKHNLNLPSINVNLKTFVFLLIYQLYLPLHAKENKISDNRINNFRREMWEGKKVAAVIS
jgi:hypothetical protein